MASKYRIRRVASDADWAALRSLERALFPYDDQPNYARDKSAWWVMTHKGEIIGFAGGYVTSENAFYLSRAGVAEAYQGKGLQKRLIRVRLAHAKRVGSPIAITYTYKNPASANNLIACGFRSYLPHYKWGGKHSDYWRKKLK